MCFEYGVQIVDILFWSWCEVVMKQDGSGPINAIDLHAFCDHGYSEHHNDRHECIRMGKYRGLTFMF